MSKKIVVTCVECGQNYSMPLNHGDETYVDDIMIELGWYKDHYGKWHCDECEEID